MDKWSDWGISVHMVDETLGAPKPEEINLLVQRPYGPGLQFGQATKNHFAIIPQANYHLSRFSR